MVSSSAAAAVGDECSFDEAYDGNGGRNAYDELMMHSERASKMMIGDAAALSLIGVMVGWLVCGGRGSWFQRTKKQKLARCTWTRGGGGSVFKNHIFKNFSVFSYCLSARGFLLGR